MTTIRDVARLAGVNPSTASRVLNDRSISVSDETRQRILQVSEELGYRPNASAQSLRLQKTYMAGVLVPDLTNPFFPEVLEGIRAAAAQEGFFILLANTLEDSERERAYVQILREKRVDGLIIATAADDDDVLIPQLAKSDFPYVLVSRPVLGSEDRFVGTDDFGGARLAMDHLIGLGHRRIAHLSGPLFAGSALKRLQGYRTALREHGIPFEQNLVVETNFSEKDGYRVTKTLLATEKFTAIFAASDVVALGALLACEDAGLSVPRDLSIVGFNDISLAQRLRPRLTTVHAPLTEMGGAAFRLLYQQVQGEKSGGPIIFSPELRVRESSGPPPSKG